jgi:hypothetical protein
LKDLGLSDRALEALENAGVDFEVLETLNRDDLIALQGIGEATADQIISKLGAYQQAQDEEVAMAIADEEIIGDGTGEALPPFDPSVERTGEALPFAEASGLIVQVLELTQALRWVMTVLERQPGAQGQHLAGLLRQGVLKIRPELSLNELAALDGRLPD